MGINYSLQIYRLMKTFKQPCVFHPENNAQRVEAIEWLEKLGYSYGRFVDTENIISTSPPDKSGYCYVATNDYVYTHWEDRFDCHSNLPLFKALTALSDDDDYLQWFHKNYWGNLAIPDWNICQEKICNGFSFNIKKYGDVVCLKGHWIKATAEELIEHFKE